MLVGTACSTLGGLVGGLLRRRGVDVLEADGLDAARRLLSEWGGAIDLVLLSDGFLDRAGPDPASVLADDAIASRIIVFPGDGPAAGPLDPVLAPGDRVLTGTFSAQRLVDAVAEVIAESDEAPRAAIN